MVFEYTSTQDVTSTTTYADSLTDLTVKIMIGDVVVFTDVMVEGGTEKDFLVDWDTSVNRSGRNTDNGSYYSANIGFWYDQGRVLGFRNLNSKDSLLSSGDDFDDHVAIRVELAPAGGNGTFQFRLSLNGVIINAPQCPVASWNTVAIV